MFFADCRRKIMENKGKKKSSSRNDISLDQAILQWIVDDYDISDEKSRKIVGKSEEKSKLITCEMVMNYLDNRGVLEETKEVPKIIKKEKIEWIDCIRYVDGVPNPDTSGIKEKEMGKTGTFIEYHSNGKIAKEETYYNGQLDGIAKYWHDDGELYLVRRYSSGIILEEAWEHNKNKISTILKNIWDLAVEWAEKENMKRLNGKK